MGKLEDIVARNQRASRPRERAFVGIVVGVFILVIIGLAAFTDLGTPPADDDNGALPPPQQAVPREHSIHVPLFTAPSTRTPRTAPR